MSVYLAALALIIAAVLQVAALSFLTGSALNVDLVLLLVLAWSIIRGVQEGLLWGLIGGLILDVVSAAPFGTTTAVLAGIGFLGGICGIPLRSAWTAPLVAAALATVVYDGLLMVLWALFGWEWRWVDTFYDVVFPAALLNALVMAPIYWLLDRLRRRLEPEVKW